MSMNQKDKDVLWDVIKSRIPDGAHFVCFVQEGDTEGTMVGTLSLRQVIEFLKATLSSLMTKLQGTES